MPAPSLSQAILPLLRDAFAPLGFFLSEIWQSVAPLAPDALTERIRQADSGQTKPRGEDGPSTQ